MKAVSQVVGWTLLLSAISAILLYIIHGNWSAVALVIVLAFLGRAFLGLAEFIALPFTLLSMSLASHGNRRASVASYLVASVVSKLGFAAFCIVVLWSILRAPGPPAWLAVALAWTVAGAPFYWGMINRAASSQKNIDYPAANIGTPIAGLLVLAGLPLLVAAVPLAAMFFASAIISTFWWAASNARAIDESDALASAAPGPATAAAAAAAAAVSAPAGPRVAAQCDHLKGPSADLKLHTSQNTHLEIPEDYRPSHEEDYMNPMQLEYFRRKLLTYRTNMIDEMNQALWMGDKKEATDASAGAASQEVRVRYQKLIRVVDAGLRRIESGEYGYSIDSGKEIGLDYLIMHPLRERTSDEHDRWLRSMRTMTEERDRRPTKERTVVCSDSSAVGKQSLKTNVRCPRCRGTYTHEGGLKYRMKCQICRKEFHLSNAEIIQ